jgi:hypothetical protein
LFGVSSQKRAAEEMKQEHTQFAPDYDSDQVLAERVVDLGVIEWCPRIPDLLRLRNEPSIYWTPHDAVRDPRVAMALMEKAHASKMWLKMYADYVAVFPDGFNKAAVSSSTDDSLPRAIVEACCSALEE